MSSTNTASVKGALYLWKRELVRFFRQKSRVAGALGTPVIFWMVLGSGLGSSFRPAGAEGVDYLQYFFPGMLLLTVLFTSVFSSLSVIEDRNEGFLLSVLVAPVSRWVIVLGKIFGCATLGLFQGLILLMLAPVAGISLDFGRLLPLVGALFLVSLCLSGLGFATAWLTASVQGYHAVMNVVLFPLWLLSGAVFPASGSYDWIRLIMVINPLAYALTLVRFFLPGSSQMGIVSGTAFPFQALLITLSFGILLVGISFLFVHRGRIRGLE